MNTISEEIKAKIIIEADTSGAEEAAAALEKLQGISGGAADGASAVTDAASAMNDQFAESAKGAEALNEALGNGEEALASNEEAVSNLNDTLGEHQQVAQDAATAQETFGGQVEETAKQLQVAADPLQQLTENTKSFAEQTQPAIDNMTAFQDVISSPDAWSSVQDYVKQTGQSFSNFADSIGTENVGTLHNVVAFQDIISDPTPHLALQQYLSDTQQSLSDFNASIGPENAGILTNMVSGSFMNPEGLVATQQGIQQLQEGAQATEDSLYKAAYATETANDNFTALGSSTEQVGKNFTSISGGIEDTTTAIENANKTASGGFFGSLFGENGIVSGAGEGVGGFFGSIGDGIDSVGESISGFMSGFDAFMRPLMMLQMGVQMAQGIGSWIYNANLAAEGPNASSPYSYTSQANLLGANVTAGGNQFAVGIGSGLLPAIEGWNAASGGASDPWQSIGNAIGTALGVGASGLQMMGGGLSWLLGGGGLFGNNPLVQAGQNWMTSGYEGDVNTVAQMLGQSAPFTTSTIYSGQDIQAAFQQSHYTGVSGPGDPMNAYMQAVAMNTAAGPNGYQVPYPAPNADVAADWAYFNGMPYTPAYWTNAGSLPGGGYGGTISQQDVARQMNYGTPTNWAGGIGSLISGGNPGVTEAGNTVGNSIGSFFGGLGQDWNNTMGGIGQWWNNTFGSGQQSAPSMGYTGGVGAGAGVGNATGMADYLRNTASGGGSMSNAGTGSESVQLSHTFTANVTWEAQNLEKQFTAAAQWAGQNLTKAVVAVAQWAESNVTKAVTAAAEWTEQNVNKAVTAAAQWTEQNLIKPVVAAAQWTEQNVEHAVTAAANWTEQNVQHAVTAAAEWTEQNVVKPVVAAAEWTEQNVTHSVTAAADWAEKNLEHMFTGEASWQAEGLEHTFFATAQWVMGGGVPAYAEGTSSHPGGPAVVGEGGAPEVVEHNGQFSLFDGPAFVNLPAGSAVYPLQEMGGPSPRMFASGTGDTTPVPLMIGGNPGMQTANISIHLDSQMLTQVLGISLSNSIRVGMGMRSF